MIYTIVKYQQNIIDLLHKYPKIDEYINRDNTDFEHLQFLRLSCDVSNLNDIFYQRLYTNRNYQRVKNHHIIYNELSNDRIECYVENHLITIISPNKSNIFFDILYQMSKNYVIIDKQV